MSKKLNLNSVEGVEKIEENELKNVVGGRGRSAKRRAVASSRLAPGTYQASYKVRRGSVKKSAIRWS